MNGCRFVCALAAAAAGTVIEWVCVAERPLVTVSNAAKLAGAPLNPFGPPPPLTTNDNPDPLEW